jgi:hypothetical protein
MKNRHLILCLGAVLAFSLAVPALGSSLSLRLNGVSNVKVKVKKAQAVLTGAHGVASAAMSTAADAQDRAGAAQIAANAAKSATAGAQDTAEAATVKVESAESATAAANDKANAARGKAVEGRAIAKEKIIGAEQMSQPGAGDNVKTAVVECPEESFVTGGGYVIEGEPAVPRVNEPEGQGWAVEAVGAPGKPNGYLLKAWALCTFR